MNNYLDCWVVDMWVSGKISTYPQPGFGRQLFVYEVVSDVVDRSALGICIPSQQGRHVLLSISPNSCLGPRSPYFCKVG